MPARPPILEVIRTSLLEGITADRLKTIKQTLNDTDVPVHIWTDDIEPQTSKQLANVARMPFMHRHVAATPNVHAGIGATVGSVIATRGAIIPAAVRAATEARVPVGFEMHDERRIRTAGVQRLHAHHAALLGRVPVLVKMINKPDAWPRRWARSAVATTSSSCAWTSPTGCG